MPNKPSEQLNIDEIDQESLKPIGIMDAFGVVQGGFKLVNMDPRSKLFNVLDPERNRIFKVNPCRIKDAGCVGSVAIVFDESIEASCPACGIKLPVKNNSISCKCGNKCDVAEGDKIKMQQIVAVCPKCGETCEADDKHGSCKKCGEFNIVDVMAHKSKHRTATKKQADFINLKTLDSQCDELWVKRGLEFDDPNTEVIAISLRCGDRYLSFNLYNNTYGKSGKQKTAVEALINGQTAIAGKVIGYQVKDISKWQKKLTKNGYKPFSA